MGSSLNYFFTPPVRMFTVAERENLVALFAFLAVAVSLSTVVDVAARRTREASQARAEAATRSRWRKCCAARGRCQRLEQVRETFALDSVTLLERQPEALGGPDLEHTNEAWTVVACVGGPICLGTQATAMPRCTLTRRTRSCSPPTRSSGSARPGGLRGSGHGRPAPGAPRTGRRHRWLARRGGPRTDRAAECSEP